jgi:hypothetical protein
LAQALIYVLVLFMPDAKAIDVQEMALRHAATLARVAEAAERLAMKHADRALAADDPDIEAKATAAFHSAARSLRQCLALEAKLVRDAARFERDDGAWRERRRDSRTEQRRQHVRTAVGRLIWTEAEGDDSAEALESELDDLLDLERYSEAFADEPVEAHIARICAELGITLPAPNSAPPGASGDPGVFRSSA